jgi:hypothetical protein
MLCLQTWVIVCVEAAAPRNGIPGNCPGSAPFCGASMMASDRQDHVSIDSRVQTLRPKGEYQTSRATSEARTLLATASPRLRVECLVKVEVMVLTASRRYSMHYSQSIHAAIASEP